MGLDITGIGAVADLAKGVVSRIWPDKSEVEQAKAAQALAELNAHVQEITGQLAINQAEAASPSVFTSGWRPFLGWVCGAAFAWAYVVRPLATFLLTSIGHPVALPTLDLTELSPLVMGMLGLTAARTVEKLNGVASK